MTEDGTSAGFVQAGDDAAASGEGQFRQLVDGAPVMLWRAGADRDWDWFNRRWLDYTGRPLDEETGHGWMRGVHPEDYARCREVHAQAFAQRRTFTMEYRLLRHDGQYRWLRDSGEPFRRDGEFAGYLGSCVDVTAYRQASQAQSMLIDELDHRVKNVLTLVQVLARQTFRSPEHAGQVAVFEARIKALADTHRMLREAGASSLDLRALLAGMLPGWTRDDARYRIEGPRIDVFPRAAVPLAIAFHELCTNASKYGAFSNEAGRIDVRWEISGDARPRLRLTWTEHDGPSVSDPGGGRGFGSRMLERVLAGQIEGQVGLVFAPEGLVCTLDAPMDQVGEAA